MHACMAHLEKSFAAACDVEVYKRERVGWHAVVCFAYRRFFCAEEMHVLVLDNHDDKTGGPRRWVHVEEVDTLYALAV